LLPETKINVKHNFGPVKMAELDEKGVRDFILCGITSGDGKEALSKNDW